jgi:hypothetical protein
MAVRVDNEGYLIDHRGTRLAEKDGNDKASVQARWEKILETWKANHKNDAANAAPPQGTTVMQVTKGDCQWTIAEGAGSDPFKTSYGMNKHIKDPDKIYAGDIIFVDTTKRVSQYRNQDGQMVDNVDIFRDQQQGAAQRGDVDTARKNSQLYFGSVPTTLGTAAPGDMRQEVLQRVMEGFPDKGDTEQGAGLNRQIAVEGYLLASGPDQSGSRLLQLKQAYDPKNNFANGDYPDESTSVSYDNYNGAIDDAAKNLNLTVPGEPQTQPANPPTFNFPAGPAANSPEGLILKIKTQGAQFVQSPTDANRNALHFTMAQYLGSPGSEGYKERLQRLMQDDCGGLATPDGQFSVSKEIPLAVAGSMNRYAVISRPGESTYHGDIRKTIIDLLQALPPSERQGAVDKLLGYDFKNNEYMHKQVRDIAQADGFGFNLKV